MSFCYYDGIFIVSRIFMAALSVVSCQ